MQSFGGAPNKCPRCQKAVYMAEEILGAGQKWHKMCFTCAECNKRLDSTTMADKDGQIFCKTCYGKSSGIKGYGYGQGAGVLSMDGAVSSSNTYAPAARGSSSSPAASRFGGAAEKCPRCAKSVYAAEKVTGAGASWHKACFNCKDCKKSLDSTTLADKDGEIFCKGCYGANFGPKGFGYGGGAGALTRTQ
eukprot:Colp12_sorted_trinity150504_noHs@3229